MKILKILFVLQLFAGVVISSEPNLQFKELYFDETMRIDYFHIGDAETEIVTVDQIYRYGIWAGSKINLIDEFMSRAI